jgi:SAM-dependent methyltransferase
MLHCPDCGLVFVPEARWLSIEAERQRYAHHDNTTANEGYLRFLGEVADVVCGLAGPGSRVLDFGSGEHAVLTGLLNRRGRHSVAYDPLYGHGPDALGARYDAIVLCEVIEHLHDLRAELSNIAACLGPGARVVVRTRCYPSIAGLASWWYARDPTHLRFFTARTLDVAARLCGLASKPTPLADVFIWSPSR